MNCKPGDLAVIVKSSYGNAGKVVRCIRLHDSKERDLDGARFVQPCEWPRWVIDRPVTAADGSPLFTVADFRLRPIRDNDGEDETLAWAGKPEKVTP